MAENENRKELSEAEVEGVTGGRGFAPFSDKDGQEDRLVHKNPKPAKDRKAKDDVIRPLPFPQDRRGNK